MYLLAAANLVPGTFGTFTAETTSLASTFATGSIVLENKLNGESNCVSNDDDDPETGNGQEVTDTNARDCPAMFTVTTDSPGGSSNRKVRLENLGTLDASSLTLHWTGPGACTTTDAVTETYHGTGNLCGDLRFYVQEFADEATWDANDRTGGTCWYGDTTLPNDCGFLNTLDLAHFSATHPSATPLSITGGLPSGGVRFFRVYLSLRGGVGNTMQGRQVDFGLTWTLSQ